MVGPDSKPIDIFSQWNNLALNRRRSSYQMTDENWGSGQVPPRFRITVTA
jgi:hypothetical protein